MKVLCMSMKEVFFSGWGSWGGEHTVHTAHIYSVMQGSKLMFSAHSSAGKHCEYESMKV